VVTDLENIGPPNLHFSVVRSLLEGVGKGRFGVSLGAPLLLDSRTEKTESRLFVFLRFPKADSAGERVDTRSDCRSSIAS
jgi:hypothetical protein